MTKISKSYEEVYADASCGIIRSESDASIAGRHNGADCVVVCDRKWGECTPSATSIVKFAARGISEQFRTPSALVETDGVTLKPTDGGEVFVGSTDGVTVATDYDADTGGCTVDGTDYADTAALNAAGLYVISDAVTAWDVSGSAVAKSGVGVADVWKADGEEFVLWLYTDHALKTFAANDWWEGVLKAGDLSRAGEFGLTINTSSANYFILYEPTKFNYEIIGLYSDDEGNTLVYDTLSNLSVGTGKGTTSQINTSLEIFNTDAITTQAKTWRVRITKK